MRNITFSKEIPKEFYILYNSTFNTSDMTVITELQEQIAKNRLFSYLGGADDEQESKQNE